MNSRIPESATFLTALGRRIDVRLVIYVPIARPARVFWLAPPGPDDEVDRLEEVGRSLLAAPELRDWTPAKSAQVSADPGIAITLVCAADTTPAGVVVAGKEPGYEWSRSEHALLEFSTQFYLRKLMRCGSRPLPSRTVHSAFGWRRSEAAELESGMRAAADKGELYLLYQPEVDLATDEIIAVEALSRWQHPQHGELGPESFIALAEQSDLIQVLGAWLIEESFRDFSSWYESAPDLDVVLRINVSPAQLTQAGVADQFAAALDRHGLRGEQVCIEVTENVAVADPAALAQALAELKHLGIASALDDLASGYSSLNRLRAFDVDFVKLDRGLIDGIDKDPRAQAIVRGIVGIASELDVGVIAEGVETRDEVETLVRLGCQSAQGHLFARPLSSAEASETLQARGRRAHQVGSAGR